MMIWLDFLQVEPDHQNPNSTLKRRNTEKVVPPRNAHFLCVYLSSVFQSRAPLRKVSKLGSHSQSNCLILLRAKFSICQQRSSMGMLVFVRLTSCYAGVCLGHVTQHDRQRVA